MPSRYLKLLCFFIFSFVFNCWADLAQETIYLTWQQSPSTTMTIQWVSTPQDKQSVVTYRAKQDNSQWLKVSGSTLPFPYASQYLIHRVEIPNLKPNTAYTFKVSPCEKEYHFLTAPKDLEKELNFVVGGDMYHDDIQFMAKTCQRAAQTNPAFALIGGDIAYSVKGFSSTDQKIDRWIDWLKTWHATMVTPQAYLIPVVAAIGNHDLIGQYDQTPAQAAIFSTLFPMPGSQVYNILDFNSYLTIFLLDSGHANPVNGVQAKWLETNLRKRQHIPHRFAIYHVPAYPCYRSFENKHCTSVRNVWPPIFEKEGIQVAFEHHDHAYKRTYPILKGRIDPKGVIYIGDGGWGVETPRTLRTKRPYLAKFASVRHFISVTLTPSQQKFKCITDQGHIIDEYVHSLKT